jgi:hypothetical protein
MARNQKGAPPPTNQDSQEEMTVMFVRLKGTSASLQKGFEAFKSAFENSYSPVEPQRRLSSGGTKSPLPPAEEEINGDIDEEQEDSDVIDGVVSQPTTSAKTSAPRKPKFLEDFDLNAGDVNWKDFANSRSPNENEKYLLASIWLTEKANVPEFTVPHVFTCFRAMKWNELADFSQPMRSMKSKSSYFSTPSGRKWKLTQPGIDAARSIATTAS